MRKRAIFCKTGKKGIRGQVLMLGLIALILIVVGILILFDVQRIIRGKSKTMAAIDAAALTGANWQKHSLNLIGELNLVKACSVLISDPDYGINADPATFMKVEKDELGNITEENLNRAKREYEQLQTASDTLTQMQLRICFVGPLVGFGAAQQAAKNNGLSYNYDCVKFIDEMLKFIINEDFYTQDEFLRQEYYGYQWRLPYIAMLQAIRENGRGIAVGTNVDLIGLPRLYADPPTNPDYLSYLQSRFIIDAILGRDWCLIQALVDAQWTQKWWGNIKLDRNNQKLMTGSEILNLNVKFSPELPPENPPGSGGGSDLVFPGSMADKAIDRIKGKDREKLVNIYNQMDPVTVTGQVQNDEDMKFNPLPALSWAVFGSAWRNYDNVKELEISFRAPFRKGATYTSGALSYFSVHVPIETLTSRFDFSKNLSFGHRREGGRKMNAYTRSAGKSIREAKNIADISFDAVAKPFGLLEMESGEKRPPFAAKLVLPVFKTATLVPVSLEKPSGLPMYEYDWVIYITKFLPALGESNSIAGAMSKLPGEEAALISPIVEALKLLDSPEFREQGRTWLNTEATGHDEYDRHGNFIRHVIDSTNRDHCNDWKKCNCGMCNGGPRRGLDPMS